MELSEALNIIIGIGCLWIGVEMLTTRLLMTRGLMFIVIGGAVLVKILWKYKQVI